MSALRRFSTHCCLIGAFSLPFVGGTANALPLQAWDADGVSIYDSWNRDGVSNNPTILPVFTIDAPLTVTAIWDYHWNNGAGQNPAAVGGMISLFDDSSNTLVGSWIAYDTAPNDDPHYPTNTYWKANPNVLLNPGRYRIEDSDRATWSYSTTRYFDYIGFIAPNWQPGVGFSQVSAIPVPAGILTMPFGLAALSALGLRRRGRLSIRAAN